MPPLGPGRQRLICARAASVCEILEGPLGAGSYRWLICGGEAVKSLISKRSIVIAGHKTSVSLEDEFWNSLKEIAEEGGMTLAESVAVIDGKRQHCNGRRLFDFLCRSR